MVAFSEYLKFKSTHFGAPCLCQILPGINEGLEMSQTFCRQVGKQGRLDTKSAEIRHGHPGRKRSFHMGHKGVISLRMNVSVSSGAVVDKPVCLIIRMTWETS
jgi:hypothetical protein